MKRILLVIGLLVLTTGCVNIKTSSKETIIDSTLNSKYKITNINNAGFKYYLPNNMKRIVKNGSNELLKDKYYEYYFYVDLVSYYNKVINIYNEDSTAYYSTTLDHDKYFGYLNIYQEDDMYLIESIYNYGKIEVKVKEEDINLAICNMLSILSSIQYNDDTINKMMQSNKVSSKEEVVNIFDKKEEQDHDYLKEESDDYVEDEELEKDPDVIN